MERLTIKFNGGYLFNLPPINDEKAQEEYLNKISVKLGEYEDLEEHEGVEIGTPHKARLLTDEDVDKWEGFKNAEEQGMLLRLPCRLGDIIDRIISHNEIVTLMFETEVCSFRGLQHFWHGMAWNIPKEYLELPFVKIHGVVPDKITEADTIWIEVRKEAEQALARMEGENE